MISVYRGELHRVPNVPRQWTVPKSNIPLSVFKKALKKRQAALRLLHGDTSAENYTPLVNVKSETAGTKNYGTNCEVEENDGEVADGEHFAARSTESLAEDDIENREERKRRWEEDMTEGGLNSSGKLVPYSRRHVNVFQDRPERMAADSVYHREDMDCDQEALEPTSMELDIRFDLVKARDNEVGAGGAVREYTCLAGLRTNHVTQEFDGPGFAAMKSGNVSSVISRTAGLSNFGEIKPIENVNSTLQETEMAGSASEPHNGLSEREKKRRRKDQLEARLKLLTAEKHRLVLMLKQVLSNEEESKRKPFIPTASHSVHPGVVIPCDSTVMTTHVVKGVGETSGSADLEDGELEYTSTSDVSPRSNLLSHLTNVGSNSPSPLVVQVPLPGRQPSLTQLSIQGPTGRGAGHLLQGMGLTTPSTPAAAAAAAAGPLSPGGGFLASLPLPQGGPGFNNNSIGKTSGSAVLVDEKVEYASTSDLSSGSNMLSHLTYVGSSPQVILAVLVSLLGRTQLDATMYTGSIGRGVEHLVENLARSTQLQLW